MNIISIIQRISNIYNYHINNVILQAFASACTLLYSIEIYYLIGSSEFGKFSIFFLTLMMSRNVFVAIVLTPNSVFISEELRSYSSLSYFQKSSLISSFGIAISSSLFLYVYFKSQLIIVSPKYIFITILFYLYTDYQRRYLQICERHILMSFHDILRYSLPPMLFYVYPIFYRQLSVEIAVVCIAISSVVSMLIFQFATDRMHGIKHTSVNNYKKHLRHIRWSLPAVLVEMVQVNAPIFICGVILSNKVIGDVRLAQQISGLTSLLFNSLQNTLLVEVLKRNSNANIKARDIFFSIRYHIFITVTFPLLYLVGFVVLNAWGWKMEFSFFTIVFSFMASNILVLIRLPFLVLFQSKNMPQISLLISMVGAALAVALTFPLGFYIGGYALPAVTAIITAVTTLILSHYARKIH